MTTPPDHRDVTGQTHPVTRHVMGLTRRVTHELETR